jgi:hypothetical protein
VRVDSEVAQSTPEGKKQVIKTLLEQDMTAIKGLEDETNRLGKHLDTLYMSKGQVHSKLQELYKNATAENQVQVLVSKQRPLMKQVKVPNHQYRQ